MRNIESDELWRSLLSNLPAVVQIHRARKTYHVRDNTLMVVWSDDLPDGSFERLLDQICGAITAKDRKAFREILTSEAIDKRESVYLGTRLLDRSGESLEAWVQIVYGCGAGKDIMELHFEPNPNLDSVYELFYANGMHLKKVYLD